MSSQAGSTWGTSFVFRGDGTGLGVNGELWCYTRRFSDDQIKAWPTTPLEVLPAPGANHVWVVQSCVVMVDSTDAGYTNVSDTAGYLSLDVLGTDYLGNDTTIGLADLDALLTVAGHQLVVLRGSYTTEINGTGSPPPLLEDFQANQWGVRPTVVPSYSDKDDTAVHLVLANGEDGDLTGGSIYNSMLVRTFAMKVPIPAVWATLYPEA